MFFKKNKHTFHQPIDKNDLKKHSQNSSATVNNNKSNISVNLQTENEYNC